MEKIRIAFIGTGGMGQKAHLSQYAVLPQCEVVAIAEARSDLAEAVARRYAVPRYFTNHRELLDKVDADGYVCIQQYRNHLALLPDIFTRGKPVLTEKPLALSVEAGEKLVALAARHSAIHMVGNHKRSDPAMEYAKKLTEEWKASGKYGRMKYIRITMPPGDWISGAAASLGSRQPYPAIDSEPLIISGMTEDESKEYNTFVNYYIHQVNALRYLLGEPYRVTFADRSGVLMGCESVSGVPAILEMAPWSNRVLWLETYLVCFEHGTVQVELPPPLAAQRAGKVTVMKDAGEDACFESPILPNLSAMRNQAMNFLKVIAGEALPPCDGPEALEDLRNAMEYIQLRHR